MSIRNSAKAVILNDGMVLLNKCQTKSHKIFYSLPGGGQNQYETMEEAVRRECLEETGYSVKVDRFLGICEEILTGAELREVYADYTHKILHIFLCYPDGQEVQTPSEIDAEQIGCEWIPLEKVQNLLFNPALVGENLQKMLEEQHPMYLGSFRAKDSLSISLER